MSKVTIVVAVFAALLAADETGLDTEPGLVRVFFNSAGLSRPHDTGVDSTIDVDTGTTINDYSRVWQSRIAAPVAAEVAFAAEADNGCRLWIGNVLVIDGWAEDGPRRGVFTFNNAGPSLPIRVEYHQCGGTGHMRLFREWAGHPRELVPASALTHTAEDREKTETLMKTSPRVGKMCPSRSPMHGCTRPAAKHPAWNLFALPGARTSSSTIT
ncbi:MAG: PA14 domain-containing protein [Candidatus Hydrogenedentes bacterium]|nr:PA14 domain-containing protein [Candidatus Hydrogenedentota bacterium]